MKSARIGYFGMKAHVAADRTTGSMHSVVGTETKPLNRLTFARKCELFSVPAVIQIDIKIT
jgi:hypothetical protein